MYPLILLLVLACVLAAIGLFNLLSAARGKNAEAILKSTYWILGAAVAVVVGLGFLFAG